MMLSRAECRLPGGIFFISSPAQIQLSRRFAEFLPPPPPFLLVGVCGGCSHCYLPLLSNLPCLSTKLWAICFLSPHNPIPSKACQTLRAVQPPRQCLSQISQQCHQNGFTALCCATWFLFFWSAAVRVIIVTDRSLILHTKYSLFIFFSFICLNTPFVSALFGLKVSVINCLEKLLS